MTGLGRHDRSQSGFTLLELLIAITILGLILVALTNGVRFAGQAWETQTKRIARQGDLDAVQNVVRQLVTPAKRLSGTPLSLKFVGALPAALARGGLYDIELRTLNGRLVLVWQPHFKGTAATMQQSVTELAEDVTGLELAYYLPGAGWLAANGNKTPALVRIVMQVEDGRRLPPLLVAPMVDGETSDAK
jgi:general secretion pathway protein J